MSFTYIISSEQNFDVLYDTMNLSIPPTSLITNGGIILKLKVCTYHTVCKVCIYFYPHNALRPTPEIEMDIDPGIKFSYSIMKFKIKLPKGVV